MIAPHLIPIKSPPPFPLKLNIVHFARPLRWAPQFFLLGISVFLGSELVGKLRNSTLLREIAKLVSLRGLANLFWAFQPSWCPSLHGKSLWGLKTCGRQVQSLVCWQRLGAAVCFGVCGESGPLCAIRFWAQHVTALFNLQIIEFLTCFQRKSIRIPNPIWKLLENT